MKAKKETRFVQTAELRAEKREDESPVIKGYAAVFDKWADIGGWFMEKIRKGAFKKTIGEADIRALLNHDANYVLGRNKSDTLRLAEDKKGLAVEIDPPDAQWANDLLVSMERGDISQMSFGFEVIKEAWDNERDERELIEVRLFDVSVVTFPAYDSTSAQVRQLIDIPDSELNIDSLTGVLFRASRGVELKPEDREMLENHCELIRSYIPEPEPEGNHSGADDEPGDHSEGREDETGRICRMRERELELIELEG